LTIQQGPLDSLEDSSTSNGEEAYSKYRARSAGEQSREIAGAAFNAQM
jgi:hypothetical protein